MAAVPGTKSEDEIAMASSKISRGEPSTGADPIWRIQEMANVFLGESSVRDTFTCYLTSNYTNLSLWASLVGIASIGMASRYPAD